MLKTNTAMLQTIAIVRQNQRVMAYDAIRALLAQLERIKEKIHRI